MTIQPVDFNLAESTLQWLSALAAFLGVALGVAFVTSLAAFGKRGPVRFYNTLMKTINDFISMSPRRVLAVASLTFKEAVRRKALLVFVVFAVLFMFASWFLTGSSDRPDMQVSVYVSFVLKAVGWLVIPVMLLLSCWGIPEDIRLRSLHTVVTKPARRNEVVLGRMVGFSAIGTLILSVMAVIGNVWVQRQVPDDVDLICRVPVYGSIRFLDRTGQPGEGVNVGDIVATRQFIEGGTKAAGIWTFELPPPTATSGSKDDEIAMTLESRFEAFRTWKGDDMGQTLQVRLLLVNEAAGLRVPMPIFNVAEFTRNEIEVPRVIEFQDERTREKRQVDLYEDLAPEGELEVYVQCLDRSQFIGVSEGDFFIRLPDRPFESGYYKAVVGLWLLMVLTVIIGVTSSCFVKGPVATLLTFTMGVIGLWFQEFLGKILDGTQRGGNAFESIYRMLTHMNEQTPLPEGVLTTAIQKADMILVKNLWLVRHAFPDLTPFTMSEYVAKGFDVPFNGALLPSMATTFAYAVPCLLIAYFSLSLRELEAK